MPSSKGLLKNSKLYLILDTQVKDYETLLETAKKAVLSGVRVIQLRDKFGEAKDSLKFSRKILGWARGRIVYIVNDRVDIAKACGASGVHVGQDDLPVVDARKILGRRAVIGVSCQNWDHAQKAQGQGADYIGFGSVFKTLTKPDRKPMDQKMLKKVLSGIKIPVFAIGGINSENMLPLRTLGVQRFAACRAILEARDTYLAVNEFHRMING